MKRIRLTDRSIAIFLLYRITQDPTIAFCIEYLRAVQRRHCMDTGSLSLPLWHNPFPSIFSQIITDFPGAYFLFIIDQPRADQLIRFFEDNGKPVPVIPGDLPQFKRDPLSRFLNLMMACPKHIFCDFRVRLPAGKSRLRIIGMKGP